LIINGDAICCEPHPYIRYSCCCFDHNLKLIEINYPSGFPPINFIDTSGLDCDECDLGVVC
jgi:hypothetical protein